MRKFLVRVLNKCASLLSNERGSLEQQNTKPEYIQAKRVEQWFKDEGDKNHRLNYELNSDSLVFDLGGYEGQWSSDIYAKYNCSIMIFEPYIPYAENIKWRFAKNDKIEIYMFGLGARTEKVGFSLLENASSVFANAPKSETIEIVSVVEFIKAKSIEKIDLLKINIEGGEYELLEAILDNNLAEIIKNIQVQFHDFIIENARERMLVIQNKLSLTHELTYQYDFVWENWKLKC